MSAEHEAFAIAVVVLFTIMLAVLLMAARAVDASYRNPPRREPERPVGQTTVPQGRGVQMPEPEDVEFYR
jgi:hypothetical protein